ncbi:MAG TPA: bifunctional diguanylate cyclase/phosphodiesterase [Steroidobacteraceae bacterium]|nr:bifunctional diguanylate cyclase/phosphodiesterase [Steroidobacteraceae bacterium]
MARSTYRLFALIGLAWLAAEAATVAALAGAPGALRTAVLALGALLAVTGAALAVRAMNRAARREARLWSEAYEDPLTGLPNRGLAEDYLEGLLRRGSAAFALIVLEIRNVREINAALGHDVGDDALKEVGRRLRANSAAGDLVARLSGNQFLVVAQGAGGERALELAQQLTAFARADLHLHGVSPNLQIDAGICRHPEHGGTARELLRRAQIAVVDAGEVRGRIAPYRPGRDEGQHRTLQLAADLRAALEQNALTLVFQPEVRPATGAVVSFEALVRWNHPDLGPISPAEFVPIAERTGSSRRLTSWAVNCALAQMARWRAQGLDPEVAVNLSAPDILDPQLVDEVLAALEAHGVPARRLVLEITESAVMRDPAAAARNMQLLRLAGLRFAIDDFGTGHSGLSQLNRLPLDQLKIDRSFVTHAHERPDDETIVRSTIELAHRLGLRVVAEGVECAPVLALLTALGCDLVQGELISAPLTPEHVPGFVRGGGAAVSPETALEPGDTG